MGNRREFLQALGVIPLVAIPGQAAGNQLPLQRVISRLTENGWQQIEWKEQKPGDKIMCCAWIDGRLMSVEFWEPLESPWIGREFDADGTDWMAVPVQGIYGFNSKLWGSSRKPQEPVAGQLERKPKAG